MVGKKITRQRMENSMDGMEIALSRDGWHKNSSPKEGIYGELYSHHENNSPNRWMAQK